MKFRVLVVGAAVLVLGLGITQVRNASVDVLPEFAPPQVEIQAEALGLSAAEVEQLITVPLEQAMVRLMPAATIRARSPREDFRVELCPLRASRGRRSEAPAT